MIGTAFLNFLASGTSHADCYSRIRFLNVLNRGCLTRSGSLDDIRGISSGPVAFPALSFLIIISIISSSVMTYLEHAKMTFIIFDTSSDSLVYMKIQRNHYWLGLAIIWSSSLLLPSVIYLPDQILTPAKVLLHIGNKRALGLFLTLIIEIPPCSYFPYRISNDLIASNLIVLISPLITPVLLRIPFLLLT